MPFILVRYWFKSIIRTGLTRVNTDRFDKNPYGYSITHAQVVGITVTNSYIIAGNTPISIASIQNKSQCSIRFSVLGLGPRG